MNSQHKQTLFIMRPCSRTRVTSNSITYSTVGSSPRPKVCYRSSIRNSITTDSRLFSKRSCDIWTISATGMLNWIKVGSKGPMGLKTHYWPSMFIFIVSFLASPWWRPMSLSSSSSSIRTWRGWSPKKVSFKNRASISYGFPTRLRDSRTRILSPLSRSSRTWSNRPERSESWKKSVRSNHCRKSRSNHETKICSKI